LDEGGARVLSARMLIVNWPGKSGVPRVRNESDVAGRAKKCVFLSLFFFCFSTFLIFIFIFFFLLIFSTLSTRQLGRVRDDVVINTTVGLDILL
jgi:hypothetical protein